MGKRKVVTAAPSESVLGKFVFTAASYAGAYSKTSMAYYFHDHEFELASSSGDTMGASRAKLAIESMVRTAISMTQVGYTGSPIDFHGLAYWSHRLIPDTAMMHIKHGERNDDWQSGLDLMKFYLRGLEPRFKLYGRKHDSIVRDLNS